MQFSFNFEVSYYVIAALSDNRFPESFENVSASTNDQGNPWTLI